jgi:hypothetical protein
MIQSELVRVREALIGASNGFTSTIWVEGPREWSPRKRLVEEAVALIRRAIPPELLVSRDNVSHFAIGKEIYHVDATYNVPGRSGVIAKIVLMAMVGEGLGLVYLCSDGRLLVRKEVIELLRGEVAGYEHLAGRWPWGEALGPVVERVE